MSTARPGPAPARARFRTLPEWLHWQESLHYPAIALGLDRCRSVAQRLGLLPAPFVVLTVGGTNGKGSCTTLLDLILRADGYKVGKYTSPHLLRYNERICIDGTEADDAALCRVFDQVDRARDDVTLTFFEFGTLAALLLFRNAGVDVAVMEVGLGGRLDAVNILDADAALISSVDLDHEAWLGSDRESIGAEKAGIFRSGRPAVCADPGPPDSVRRGAVETGAQLFLLQRDYGYTDSGATWEWRCGEIRLAGLPAPGRLHACQIQNAAGVLTLLHSVAGRCPVSSMAIRTGLETFAVPGRFQIVPGAVAVVLDVAHNPQAARALAVSLGRLPCAGTTRAVLGMLRDKNHAAFIEALASHVGDWHVATLEGERGFPGQELARIVKSAAPGARLSVWPDVAAALRSAQSAAQPGDRIVVTGSFITVGTAMATLNIESQHRGQ